jgi:hypothetical protein
MFDLVSDTDEEKQILLDKCFDWRVFATQAFFKAP